MVGALRCQANDPPAEPFLGFGAAQVERGQACDKKRLADFFAEAMRLGKERLLDLCDAPEQADMAAEIQRALDTFLRAWGPDQ